MLKALSQFISNLMALSQSGNDRVMAMQLLY